MLIGFFSPPANQEIDCGGYTTSILKAALREE
jgi:hypothetical protein